MNRGESISPGGAIAMALSLVVALAAVPINAARGQDEAASRTDPPGHAVLGAGEAEAAVAMPQLPAQIQVVRFKAPRGVRIEVLEPMPVPVPLPADADEDETDGLTVGLMVGVGYRLRLSNLPNAPEAELFPVVEVVGHLHRPPHVDPAQFPIRVVFSLDDLIDVADRGRLVTHVVYLEDPDQALPISLPEGEIPMATLSPIEEPLRVADALGRVMAIVRVGGRVPTAGDPASGFRDLGRSTGRCPFATSMGGRCGIPICPPIQPAAPPRPLFPGDEYLCDGGDHGSIAGIGPDGMLSGVEPRDAMIRFNAGPKPHILPTNTVCLFSPRFAAVRTSLGANQQVRVQSPVGAKTVERQMLSATVREPLKVAQNEAPTTARHRSRASGMRGRLGPIEHIEVRVLNEVSILQRVDDRHEVRGAQVEAIRVKPDLIQEKQPPLAIKTAEGTVVTGIVQSAGQTVMAWKPGELAGVEEPPDRPGLAVLKEASASEADAGQVVTFTIRWRNMGNVPVASVSIVDSLLPRLEYVRGSARGPAGTVFTAASNAVGSTELRWDLPAPVPPGGEGSVSFEAMVR